MGGSRWARTCVGVVVSGILAACGGGGADSAAVQITIEAIDGPFTENESPFVIRGDFARLVGGNVAVRFVAASGEPFLVNRLPAAQSEQVGTVTSETTVEGTGPIVRFCGLPRVEAFVEIGIPDTLARTTEALAIFVGPQVTDTSILEASAAQPTAVTLTTSPLPRATGAVQVRWRAARPVFLAATQAAVTTPGTIISNTTIQTSTPGASICDGGGAVDIIVDHVEVDPEYCVAGATFTTEAQFFGNRTITLIPARADALSNALPVSAPYGGEPRFAAAIEDPFVVDGDGFGPVGGQAQLTLRAVSGTPFEDGTSDELTLPVQIDSPQRLRGRSPVLALCGVDSLDATATVVLPNGGCTVVPGLVTFVAPTITDADDGAGGTTFAAVTPTLYRVRGTDFGPVGGTALVTFASTTTDTPFAGGIDAAATVAGLILDRTTIQGLTPLALLCPADSTAAGSHAASVAVTVAVEMPQGACAPAPFGSLTFAGPTVTAFDGNAVSSATRVPSTVLFGGDTANEFVITGTGFGPVGSSAVVTFEDTTSGTPFDGAANAAVVSTIVDAQTIRGTLPTIGAPRLEADVTVRLRVTMLNGSCAFCNDAVTFTAPPSIEDVTSDQAVAGESGTALLTRCAARVTIDGVAFDPAITHAILDADDETAVDSGSLDDLVVTSTSIEGRAPRDDARTVDFPLLVRVTNPDGQFDEFSATDLRGVARGRTGNVNAAPRADHAAGMECWIDPSNPQQLVVLSHEATSVGDGIVLLRSTDAGTTWSATPIDNALDGLGSVVRRDPRLADDGFGHLYLVYVAETTPAQLRCLQSDDAGATFLVQRTVATDAGSGLLDPFIGAGPNGNALTQEAVYVGWTDTGTHATGASTVVISGATVASAGATLGSFSAPTAVSDLLANVVKGACAVDTDGALCVVFHNTLTDMGDGPLILQADTDADGLFGPAALGVDSTIANLNVGVDETFTPQPNRGVSPGTQIVAIDAGTHTDRLVIVYADETTDESGDLDVFSRTSDDAGATWSAAVRVDGDTTTRSQFLPALARDRASGALVCAWYDARNDTAGRKIETHASISTDGAVTWKAAMRLADAASDVNDLTSTRDFGPYLGVAMYDGCALGAWSDNSDSLSDNADVKAASDVYVSRFQMP